MKKLILFALTALFIAPGNIISARGNTANNLINENRKKPFAFYVNLTNRTTANHTYKKSLKRAIKDLTDIYGDSISADSIKLMLPLEPVFFERRDRTSKIKCKALIALDSEVEDFAAVLDKAHDAYCQFELNNISDTIMLDGKNKQMAQLLLPMVKNGGVSVYTTHTPFMLSYGYALVIYSENRKIQSIVYFRNRPFRIFF